MPDRWTSGTSYDAFVGRWSRLVAPAFLDWLAVPPGQHWLDIGSGTGALTEAILARCDPASVVGVEPSDGFVAHATAKVADGRATFRVGTAGATGLPDASVDAAAAALVLNFVPDVGAALAETHRVVVPGGVAAAYVWDYADGMQLLRRFWDAVAILDPDSGAADEGGRFAIANPEALSAAFRDARFEAVETHGIVIPTVFASFDDYWAPLLGGAGPAGSYAVSRTEAERTRLRDHLRASLPIAADGSIPLTARAWAVRGRRPG